MQVLKKIFNVVFLLFIFLLALSALLNKRFIQFIPLVLVIAMFIPAVNKFLKSKVSLYSKRTQLLLIVLFFALYLFAGKFYIPATIYKTKKAEKELMSLYNKFYNEWPEGTQEINVNNNYGKVHLLVCGPDSAAPLFLFPAENFSAVSWKENIKSFSQNYRCYVVDPIGEAGKSKLADLKLFPRTGKDIADLYLQVADSLHLKKMSIAGISAGARIGLLMAAAAPDRVDSLFLISPLGFTKPADNLMWSAIISAMFPIPLIDHIRQDYLLTNSDKLADSDYQKWLFYTIQGTIPYSAYPMPLTDKELKLIKAPALIILATKDQIAGSIPIQKMIISKLSNTTVKEVEGSHYLNLKQPEKVNELIKNYLTTTPTENQVSNE